MTDADENYFYAYFEVNYGLTSEKLMRKAIEITARDNSYHPIRDYLNTLIWDGKERIRYLLKKYMGSDDTELTYQCVLHFMLGCIMRVFRPGCKYEEMLCLVGGQGAGKSTFFRFLAVRDEWFQDDLEKIGDSKVYEKLAGHWIIELSEMIGAINAKSIEELKSFLSRQRENYRIAYHQYSNDRPRQCVFAGTTNTKQFLPFDRTGARRFLPVEVHPELAEVHILENESESRAYINQAWAEAMHIYRTGNVSMQFNKEIQKELDTYRKQFMQEDTMAGIIQQWLDEYTGNHVCTLMIWEQALGRYVQDMKRFNSLEINEIMHNSVKGWESGPIHRFSKYGSQRSFVRKQDVNRDSQEGFRPLTVEQQLTLPFEKSLTEGR